MCSDKTTRANLIRLLRRLSSEHSGKIGVLLPLTSNPNASLISTGLTTKAKELGLDVNKDLVILDTLDDVKATEQQLSKLIFVHKVSMVVGGLGQKSHQALERWTEHLQVPYYALQASPNHGTATWPNPKDLVEGLLAESQKRGFKKIAILRPDTAGAENFARMFASSSPRYNVTVAPEQHLVYRHGRFDSMESTAKQLFKLRPEDRRDEYRDLIVRAKQNAAKLGKPFNPKMVALQPAMTMDALFIVDHFRSVRHMVKVLQYLGVAKLPLFGHHEWRSEGLIQPPEPFLDGSFFADFIGSYTDLPASIRPEANGYFVSPDQATRTDFTVAGYQVLDQIKLGERDTTKPRRAFATAVKADTKSRKVYLFEVKQGALQLLH
jgi:hypothetical protein